MRHRFWWALASAMLFVVGCGGSSVETTPDAAPIDAKPVAYDAVPIDAIVAPPVDARPIDTAPVTVDAALPDARPIDATPPPPVDAAVIDTPPPPIDAMPVPDACVSDPRCAGSAGAHCTTDGVVTCVAAGGCFAVEGEAVACADHQTCPAGGSACACDLDPRCATGAGGYCDPAGSGEFHTCAADDNGCVVSGADQACAAPKLCGGAGSCTCPAVVAVGSATAGAGCDRIDQLICGDGNVLICAAVGGCDVWQVSTDCGGLALTCNNNQCVCPTNTSHNFYVGPNFDRSAAPAALSPNGLLTSNGLCTFATLGQGLFAADVDVALRNAATARVVAVALPIATATFSHETFPLVVGDRTTLTTYDDPDPGVGGKGLDPSHYLISFNTAAALVTDGVEQDSLGAGVAVYLDPTANETGTPAAGDLTALRGFTISATWLNLNCPDPSLAGEQDDDVPAACDDTVGGASTAIVGTGGRLDVQAVTISGAPSDAAPAVLPADFVARPLLDGMYLADLRPATPGDGPWGSFDRFTVTGTEGPGVLSVSNDTGTIDTPHRSVFSHLQIHDCLIGILQAGGSSLTIAGDPAMPRSNQITGSPGTATTPGTMAIGLEIVPQEGFNPDFDATDLLVTGADAIGALLDNPPQFSGTPTTAQLAPYALRFHGGEISGTTVGGAGIALGTGWGVYVPSAGGIVDPSSDDSFDASGAHDRSGDDVQVGGVLFDGTVFQHNDASALAIGANQAEVGRALRRFPLRLPNARRPFIPDGPAVYPATLVTMNNVSILDNGGLRDDVGLDFDGDGTIDRDAPAFTHDGVFVEQDDADSPTIVTMNGGAITGSGIVGDSFLDPAGELPVNSLGNGVLVTGGTFIATAGAVIANSALGGVDATDFSEDSFGAVVLDDTTVSGNAPDTCASQTHGACHVPALSVANHGGFHTRNGTQVIQNGGIGVYVVSDAVDAAAGSATCGRAKNEACPLQVFSGTTIAHNGIDTARENTFALARGFYAEQAAVILDQGTIVNDNVGVGVEICDGAVGYIGDITVTHNGFNAGAFADASLTTTVPAPRSGLLIDGDALVVVTGVNGKGALFSNNALHGIELEGELDALLLESTGNGGDGIYVDVLTTPDQPSVVKNVELDHNAGDGLTIVSTGDEDVQDGGGIAVPSCTPDFRLAGDRPTVRSLTSVHDNGGNGVTVAATEESVQQGTVCAQVGDADISKNAGYGIVTGQPDPIATVETQVVILDNDVFSNGKNGLLVNPSYVGQIAGTTPTFSQNKFHSNGANQVVFSGGGDHVVYSIDSPSGFCDAGANAFYCYGSGGTFGVFAEDEADVTVAHSEFAGGGTGLADYGAQAGSLISVTDNCTAVTTCP